MLSSNGKEILPVAIILLAIAVSTSLYLNQPEPEQVIQPQRILPVDAAKVVKRDIQIPVRPQGTVSQHTATTLIAEVSGRITKVPDQFKADVFFKQGKIACRPTK